ncbi:UNVERIFIED_CONTAM: hypothetical protein RMT77_009290 [Armadillidium vulgare]
MSGQMALFACSKCFSRHPFEELSQGQQLCKECRGSFPIVKCTYCRSEFQQESKSSTVTVCKKCESMVKQYGKPSACDYCNVIAAFIGNKCQRCTNSEKKYGPPMSCDQCKQKCAFDRKDDDKKKVDGKLLCWLCTLSYKRALAKTKVTDPARHSHVKLGLRVSQQHKERSKARRLSGHNKRPNRPDVTKIPIEEPPPKVSRNVGPTRDSDPSSGDQLALITQLREQIANLEKQLYQKDAQLLGKEKQMTELKAGHFTVEHELRVKMKNIQKDHEMKVESLLKKIKTQGREIAALNKGKNRARGSTASAANSTSFRDSSTSSLTVEPASAESTSNNEGGSSGTDSPSVN